MIYGRKNILVAVVLLTIIASALPPTMAATQPEKSTNMLIQIGGDVLVIGVDVPYPPPQDLEGDARYAALGIELMEQIADEQELEVEWVTVPTDSIFSALEEGEIDAVISSLPISEDFEDIAVFSEPYFSERHGLFIRYPVMNAIAEEFSLAMAREVDFTLFEAVHALSLALVAEDEAAIAEATDTLAPLLQNIGITALSLPNAVSLVNSIAETDYITAPDAIEEPLIHTNRLGGKRVGVLLNSVGEAFIMAEAPDAEIVIFESLDTAFEALEQGEIDGVFAETRPAKAVVTASENSTAILVNRRTLMVQKEFGIAVHIDPENPDASEALVGSIDDTVENLVMNGTTVALVEKWAAVPSPSTVLRVAVESMFDGNFPQLYQVVCEAITYDEDMPSPDDLQYDTASFDFSNLRFNTQVSRNGVSAEVTIQGTYSVTIDEATDEYDANTMFDEEIPVEMIYDGDNWLFCPEV